MTVTEEFLAHFHNLPGKTMGEKRKSLFLFLNNITDPRSIDFTKIQPQNFLEEKFKIDVLLRFKKSKDLIEILKGEKPLQIQRILKKNSWFIERILSSITVDELISTIFPNTSFRTKVKVLNKLTVYLNDSDKAHEYFEAIDKQYGTYLASKLLPSCRADYILNFLNTRHFQLSPKQALLIIKRYPELSEEIVDNLINFNRVLEQYTNVFEYLKLHDLNLLLELNERHRLCLRMGWRITDKYVQLHQEEIIGDPKKYYRVFHNKQIAKSLHSKFNTLYINLFPQDLDDFSNDYNTIISVLKALPKKMRQGSLLVDNYTKMYGTSFWNSPYVSLEILDMLTADERESVIETAKKPEDTLEAKWMSYLKTNKSIPFLKKSISLSSAISTRAVLVDCLVKTCKINMDDAALLSVCDYMLKTHRNDNIKVRKSFLIAIENNYDLENIPEEVWKCIHEFIGIFELNNENFEQVLEFRKMYLRYRLLRNLSAEDLLVQWVRENDTHFNVFESNPQLQLHCFNTFADIISKEMKGENLYKLNRKLLDNVQQWNNKNKEKISLFNFEEAVQSLKQKFANDDFNHSDINILNVLIKEECGRSNDCTMLKIYFGLSEKYGNIQILTWLLQNHPYLVEENIEAIIEIFLNSFYSFYREYYFFKYVKNYSSILEKTLKILLHPQEGYKKKGAVIALSCIQKAADFLKIVEEYYPTELQADAKTDAGRELYAMQEILTKCLKNLDPPSMAMESILRFCKGDYLKLIRAALYSVCDNTNEKRLISFLSQLINQAVSIRKHALHLTFRVLDKNQVYSLIKHFMEKEKNDSIRKFIFKGCFNFFIKNPDDFTWELVTLNLNAVDINDTEALEILLQFDKVPKEYRSKYVVVTWDVLNKVPDPNNTFNSNIHNLLRQISVEMVPTLPQEFYNKVISNCFLKESPGTLSFVSSSVNAFVCKYILYSNTDSEKRERLNAIFLILKDFVLKSGVRPVACNAAIDVLKEFCLPFLNDGYYDKEIFEEFAGLWNNFLQPQDSFDEYLHLKFVALYLESLPASDVGSRLGELCDSLVAVYGDVIVGMLCNKINYFANYFFKNELEDCYDMIEGVISNGASTVRLILGILLLSTNSPNEKRTRRRYGEILEKLDTEENPTIRLYLCSLYSGNLILHYINH